MTMEYTTMCRIKRARREAKLNRQRRTAVLIAAIIISVAAVFGALKIGTTEAADSTAVCVVVKSGDTLWSLAEEYKPENKEIRQFVRKIADFNELDGLMIYEGQLIRIPQ